MSSAINLRIMVCLFSHENLWSPWQQNDFETENEYEKAWILTQSHTLLHTRSQTRSRSTIPGRHFCFFCCRTKEEKNSRKPFITINHIPTSQAHNIIQYILLHESCTVIPNLYKTNPAGSDAKWVKYFLKKP